MCRFVFYQGPRIRLADLLTEPDHSLIHQSFDARERSEPLNGDGFGVAWYALETSPVPARFRSVSPAWSNVNLRELARVVRSETVLAHVRAATEGRVDEANCHPFRRGRLTFMHNGDIGGFPALRRPLLARLGDDAFDAVEGSTDSEHFFALIHDALDDVHGPQLPDALLGALLGAIETTRELLVSRAPHEFMYLNAVLTDGETAVVVRYTDDSAHRGHSLYLNQGRAFLCEDGVCRMRDPGSEGGAVLVASEPLSTDSGWTPVEPNTALIISDAEVLRSVALD